jgi:hypothetical protein
MPTMRRVRDAIKTRIDAFVELKNDAMGRTRQGALGACEPMTSRYAYVSPDALSR